MKRKPLHPSAFALSSRRAFPIHTKSHVIRGLQLFDSIFVSSDDKIITALDYSMDEIREIHKNLFARAEKYGISTKWHKCPLCEENKKEKVIFT